MGVFVLADLRVEHDKCIEFANYWRSLPKDGLIPSRSAIHPEHIPHLLPNFLMFELVSDSLIRVRLAGTALVERYGFDPTSSNYLDYVAEDRRTKAAEALWLMQRTPAGMWAMTEQVYDGDKRIHTEAIGFPVKPVSGDYPVLLFQMVKLTGANILDARKQPVYRNEVAERRFIDIGAGLPDFEE